MEIEQLTALDAMWEKGTNLHHALLLANRHFRRHPHEQPVLLVVTDGEPTSHLEPGGEVFFDYPPHPRTIALAVRELDAASRLGAQTTFFRLGEDAGLARFVDSMARRAGGKVVAPELGDLGRRRRRVLPRVAVARNAVRVVPRHVRQSRLLGRVAATGADGGCRCVRGGRQNAAAGAG